MLWASAIICVCVILLFLTVGFTRGSWGIWRNRSKWMERQKGKNVKSNPIILTLYPSSSSGDEGKIRNSIYIVTQNTSKMAVSNTRLWHSVNFSRNHVLPSVSKTPPPPPPHINYECTKCSPQTGKVLTEYSSDWTKHSYNIFRLTGIYFTLLSFLTTS